MKRDLKLAKKRGKDIGKLGVIIDLLQKEKPLSEKYRNHKLSGDYKNHWECHIEGDWLLIYLIVQGTLYLVRTGTHSDLFE
jgi:mRNA interferase YafQ